MYMMRKTDLGSRIVSALLGKDMASPEPRYRAHPLRLVGVACSTARRPLLIQHITGKEACPVPATTGGQQLEDSVHIPRGLQPATSETARAMPMHT